MMAMPAFPRRCVAWLTCLLAACATLGPPVAQRGAPLLRLVPAELGRTLALQQQLVVTAAGQTHRVEVLLEADPATVRIAVLSLGQTVARLEWDGAHLQQERAAWWPAVVSGERILSDLQLVWWPADAVRAALPAGWVLRTTPNERELAEGAELVSVVRYLSASQVQLDNLRSGYSLRIESIPLD
jgi:hypothetical protein